MKSYFEKIYKDTTKNFLNIIQNKIKNQEKMFIVTANPETFMYGTKNKEFNQLLCDEQTTIVCDGSAIKVVGNMLGYKIKERITGIDVAQLLLDIANEKKLSIYLFGAQEEVIEKLNSVIQEKYPEAHVVGYSNGYVAKKDQVFQEIKKLNPDIVMVALGIPAQEKLIYKHLNDFKKGIFIGVGGSFDCLSGIKKRAPKIFSKLYLEWLYRIILEPRRLKRFWDNNVKFIFKAFKEVK